MDVPGHERFIKNMLAGVGGIDLALFVVAADEGVMPQTREHLAILDLLQTTHGVVALSKCDLAEAEWLDLVEADVEELLAPTSLAGAAIVRCSAATGAGLDALRSALDGALSALPPVRDIGRARLPIDRAVHDQRLRDGGHGHADRRAAAGGGAGVDRAGGDAGAHPRPAEPQAASRAGRAGHAHGGQPQRHRGPTRCRAGWC